MQLTSPSFRPAEESNLTYHIHIGIWLSTVTTYRRTILQLVVQGLICWENLSIIPLQASWHSKGKNSP